MLLTFLSYVLGLATAVGLTLCLASGLSYVCEWIEEHQARSRKIGYRIAVSCAALTCVVTLTDRLPALFLLTGVLAHSLTAYSFDEKRWKTVPTVLRVGLQVIFALIPHLILLHRFHPSRNSNLSKHHHDVPHPGYLDKPRLPGGRVDWDAYTTPSVKTSSNRASGPYGSGEQLTCFVLCWLPIVWALLVTIADSWSLPLASSRGGAATSNKRSM